MNSTVRQRARRLYTQEYDRVSRVWDRYFVPLTSAMRDRLIEAARLEPGENVLDVGTGTGAAAFLAARRVGQTGFVLGIDVSRGMLAKARANAARRRLRNVRFRLMDSASPSLPDASFDAVISSFGTPEGVYDSIAVFREWIRVLRPGGRLFFCEGSGRSKVEEIPSRVLAKYKVTGPSPKLAAIRRLRSRITEERERLPLINADNPPQVKRLMERAGFRDIRAYTRTFVARLPSARAALDLLLSWDLADEYAEMPPTVRAAFRREALSALRPFESSNGLRWSTRTTFFFGRKAES